MPDRPLIREGQIFKGSLFSEPMRVESVRTDGDDRWMLGLVGVQSERFRKVSLSSYDLEALTILDSEFTYEGEGALLRLGLQAYALGIAYEFDPYFGLSISRVDPLPHQLEAIYDCLLKLARVRFLLADDAGAGKTIMAGLLIKELKLRGLIEALPRESVLRDPFDAANPPTPKTREAVQDEVKTVDGQPKTCAFFEQTMSKAFTEGRRVLKDEGLGCVVFAHKTTEGWEALLSGMIRGGWTITASWPFVTERPGSLRSQDSAALATSVHLVASGREGLSRPRKASSVCCPSSERAKQLFGQDGTQIVAQEIERGTVRDLQMVLFPDIGEATAKVQGRRSRKKLVFDGSDYEPGREATTLDRVHAAMLLAAPR